MYQRAERLKIKKMCSIHLSGYVLLVEEGSGPGAGQPTEGPGRGRRGSCLHCWSLERGHPHRQCFEGDRPRGWGPQGMAWGI